MKTASDLRKETLSYIKDGITYVCKNFKDRSPGSASEKKAQEYFVKELEPLADEVISETFTLHPKGFMGFIPIVSVMMFVSTILFFLQRYFELPAVPYITVVLALISVAMFLFEFLLYREFVDFLFPKAESVNVYAVRKAKNEPTRRIIFGGHADAAHEWTYSLHGQIKTLAPVIGGGILSTFAFTIINIVYLATGKPALTDGAWNVVSWVLLVTLVFYFALLFFINWRVIVDGANDNLSACFASIGILREMVKNDFRYDNTEVGVIITGSEEAGLRGALAFGKKHADELNKIETVIIPLETLREVKHLAIYKLDQTGTVRNDEKVAQLLKKAGKNVGIDLPYADIYPGSTDAAGFTRTGIRSCGLGGVDHNPQTYYHTRFDSYDNIGLDCIEKTLEICVEAANIFDKEGLA
ncbi:MAG: M20/M25/M40 family metallo-hydrolase [Acutalibacteraceae bacterium]|jgi:hypothetical protein